MSEPTAQTIWPEKKKEPVFIYSMTYDLPEIITFKSGERCYARTVMACNEEHKRILDALEQQNPELGYSYMPRCVVPWANNTFMYALEERNEHK